MLIKLRLECYSHIPLFPVSFSSFFKLVYSLSFVLDTSPKVLVSISSTLCLLVSLMMKALYDNVKFMAFHISQQAEV